MKFLILVLVLIVLTWNTDVFGQKSQNVTDNPDHYLDSKIHPTLIKWKNSENPSAFAQQSNLSFKDNTVRVYIHLTSPEHLSSISSEVEIVSSYQKTVDAFVSSEQIDRLKHFEFVEKISLPEFARNPPIPTPPTQTQPEPVTQPEKFESQENYLIWIVPAGLAVLITFVIIFIKQRKVTS